YGVKPWDIAAGVLLVREAGGMVGRLEGDEELFAEGTIIAGNPWIYERLRAILEKATPPA
ncbi:MAG TPA: inositol monophosphatase, partial [Rhodospirillales bacterium]|nr:inositol monophosphatase [Rhodospirillales bacterium]